MGKFSKKPDPTTPSAPQVEIAGAYKTVVASHLSYSVTKSELIEFFKQAGEVVDARYRFEHCKGTCFIEFATEEAVNKALDLDGQYLCNRDIKVRPLVATNGASNTLVAKSLSFSTTESDVIEFFKQAWEMIDVRFSLDHNGNFRGNCRIEFATAEAAMKAAELNGEYLLGLLYLALLVKPYLSKVQRSLVELFSTCGEISWMHIPTFRYTGIPRGIAFMGLFDSQDFHKALAMNGHKLGHSTLTVKDSTPVRLDAQPTGGSMRLRGNRIGSIYPFGCYSTDRGWGGAGIGKDGNIYHLPSGGTTNKAEFGENGWRSNKNDMSSTVCALQNHVLGDVMFLLVSKL